MRALSSQAVLDLWETSYRQHPLDQALTLLNAALPDQPRQALAQLSIGQRDAQLLRLYERTFGPQLAAQAYCPACQGQVEFLLNTAELYGTPAVDLGGEPLTTVIDGYSLAFRLPNSVDLAALVALPTVEGARQRLIERCVVQVLYQEVEITAAQLPAPLTVLLAKQMAACDPQAEIELDLVCPHCAYHWPLLLDIVRFLWAKIEAQAKRLLHEVHQLAQAYGWCEAEILALSPLRRQLYLGMVS